MRICFVSPGVYYSRNRRFHQQGSESVILGISKYLAAEGHEIIITGRFGEDNGNFKNIEFLNIESPSLKDNMIHEIGSSLLYSRSVAKEINKLDIDVISLHERFSGYCPSKLKIPKTFTTHNPDAMDFYKKFAVKLNSINYILFNVKKMIEENVMKNSNKIISLNEDISAYLHLKNFNNVITVPNAINVERYANKGDKNFILFAGRLSKVKGIEYLIHAFLKLNPKYDMNLLIVGSGPDELRLKKIADSKDINGKIRFISMVDKSTLREYLSKCSIFVLPSLFETFGIILIEAMASGKPVIASNIPGPKNIINNGFNGFLFEKENDKELGNYLKLLIENNSLRKQIGNNARKTVEERYTFEKIAEEYLNVFNMIIREK